MKCRRFRLENGEGVGDRDEVLGQNDNQTKAMNLFFDRFFKKKKKKVYNSPTTPVLENPEYQTRWYFKYFLGKREYFPVLLLFVNSS
jgi:hypothetical protein